MDSSILSENQGSLASEATKRIIGERNIDLWQTYKANSRGASRRARTGNFLNMLGQGALDYLMSNLTQIIMGSILTLYVFDWNQTDAEIKAQMEANDLAMLTASGRLAADGIVRFAAMGAVKQAKHRYPRIDPYALAQLEEDNQDELISQLRSFLLAARGNIVSNTMLSTYMSGRAMMFGAKTQKTESFIVSDQIQKIAESQKDPKIKAFLTGFVSQAEDTIFELAYLVVNTIQATYEMNRLAARQGLGPHRVVQFTPDASDPSTKTVLYGPQEQIMGEITSAVNQQAVLSQKDLGSIVQVGIDTALKATRNERQVVAYFYSGVNGATMLPDGKRSFKREMRLSNLKISVDWDRLKSTLTPFDGGSYKVVAHLDDGHNLTGFFVSESEGKSYLTKVSALCNGDIKKWTTIEPNSDVRFRIQAGRFTISTATLRVAKHTSDEKKKTYIDSLGQMWKVKAIKLPLRRDEKPEGIDATIMNPWGDTLL